MKITKDYLKKVIKEEYSRILKEVENNPTQEQAPEKMEINYYILIGDDGVPMSFQKFTNLPRPELEKASDYTIARFPDTPQFLSDMAEKIVQIELPVNIAEELRMTKNKNFYQVNQQDIPTIQNFFNQLKSHVDSLSTNKRSAIASMKYICNQYKKKFNNKDARKLGPYMQNIIDSFISLKLSK